MPSASATKLTQLLLLKNMLKIKQMLSFVTLRWVVSFLKNLSEGGWADWRWGIGHGILFWNRWKWAVLVFGETWWSSKGDGSVSLRGLCIARSQSRVGADSLSSNGLCTSHWTSCSLRAETTNSWFSLRASLCAQLFFVSYFPFVLEKDAITSPNASLLCLPSFPHHQMSCFLTRKNKTITTKINKITIRQQKLNNLFLVFPPV